MNPCRQRGFSAPPKRFMYRLHKQRISTFFTLVRVFFFKKGRFFLSSYCRHRMATLALKNASTEAGGSEPPRFNILLSKKKRKKKKKKEK